MISGAPSVGIDHLDRFALVLRQHQIVVIAVGHDRALAEQDLLRRIGRRLHLHHLLLRELFEELPAEIARQDEGGGQDRAAVAGMRLDDLAAPFRVEQIGIALRRVLAGHEVGVVADRLDPGADRRVGAVGIDLVRREVLRHLLRQIRLEPVVLLPVEIMRGVGGVGDVNRLDAAALLLRDALEDALGAGALDAHGDAWIFCLEGPRDAFGDVEFERAVEGKLALLARRLDQGRRHARSRRRGCPHRLGEHRCRDRRSRHFQKIASRPSRAPHRRLPILLGTIAENPRGSPDYCGGLSRKKRSTSAWTEYGIGIGSPR